MIEITKMSCGYRGKKVLYCDHLTFPDGKITGIIGANGNGKSTLLRAVEGILPYEGSIRVAGRESREMTTKERARYLAYLPQATKAVNLPVEKLVEHGRFAYLGFSKILSEKDHAIVREAMEMTDVARFAGRILPQISGGEKQRAYLAMAIAQRSRMLLLDEPTTGLDIDHQTKIMKILRLLAGRGCGVVMTLHDIPQAFTVSDQIVLIGKNEEGRGILLAKGTPEELAGEPEVLRKGIGAAVVKTDLPGQCYDYALVR